MTAQTDTPSKPRFTAQTLATWILPVIIVGILAVMALVEPRFYSRLNIFNILRNFTLTSLLALAQALVMIVGGFDLSIGAIMAAGSVVAGRVAAAGRPAGHPASLGPERLLQRLESLHHRLAGAAGGPGLQHVLRVGGADRLLQLAAPLGNDRVLHRLDVRQAQKGTRFLRRALDVDLEFHCVLHLIRSCPN